MGVKCQQRTATPARPRMRPPSESELQGRFNGVDAPEGRASIEGSDILIKSNIEQEIYAS